MFLIIYFYLFTEIKTEKETSTVINNKTKYHCHLLFLILHEV